MSDERETRAGLVKLRQTYERQVDSWIRRDDSGWRFYDNQGRRFVLSAEEGKALHRQAREQVDRLIGGLEGNSWLMLVPAVLVGVLALRLAAEFALVRALPSAVYFVPCVLFLFKDVTAEIRFALSMQHWREEQAKLLRARDGREHEAASYSWLFDPRLGTWAAGAMGCLALGALAIFSKDWAAILLIALGLPLVCVALFGMGRTEPAANRKAPPDRKRNRLL
jgi:hypothetical protein